MTNPGTILEGKYEILKEIGRGGMSYVYLATDTRLNKQWAVKEVKKNANNQQNQLVVQSLITEANLMKKLNHPSFPRIVDIIESQNTLYVVMDFVEGESLENVIKLSGRQSEDDVISWAIKMCDALEYLHTRKPPIVHRDIKPANIILQPEPQNAIKVLDLGIAKELVEDNTAGTKCIGTPGYASPEQSVPGMVLDGRSDIYSLGATMHHLLTGMDPRRNVGFKKLRLVTGRVSEKTEGLEAIIEKCLKQDANLRYQTCAELRYDLENVEKLTRDYRSKQIKKVSAFTAFTALTLVFSMLAGIFNFTYTSKKADTIESYVMNITNAYSLITGDGPSNVDYDNFVSQLSEMTEDISNINKLTDTAFSNSNSFAAYSVYMYLLNNRYKLSTINAQDGAESECFALYNEFKDSAVEFAGNIKQTDDQGLALYVCTLNAFSLIFDDVPDIVKAKAILAKCEEYTKENPTVGTRLQSDNVQEKMDSFEQGSVTGFLGDGSEIVQDIDILSSLVKCIELSNSIAQGNVSNTGLAGESSDMNKIEKCADDYTDIINKAEDANLSPAFKLYVYRNIYSFIKANTSNDDENIQDTLRELCSKLSDTVAKNMETEKNSNRKQEFAELSDLIKAADKEIENFGKTKVSMNE